MAYAGVVFDFDGVLFDSEKHWPSLENPYLLRHIPSWKDKYYAQLTGRSLPEIHTLLVREYAFPLAAEEYYKDYEEMAMQLYARVTEPLQGAEQALAVIRGSGKKVAIASSSRSEWISAALSRSTFADSFSEIITAYDPEVKRSKPAPDIYLCAATHLAEEPRRLIAIEDSRNGVQAAKSAGLYCIGLRNGFNDDQDLSGADEIMHGYLQASAQRLKDLLV